MPNCKNCQKEFPNNIVINGITHSISSRKFCLECSPFGSRNTRSYIIDLKENEGFCSRCSNIKNIKKFYKRKNGRPLSYCIDCQNEVKQLKFEEKTEMLVELFGGKCKDCEISYPPIIYCFYDENNVYYITKLYNMSLGRAKKKFENYDMLCRNCYIMRKWINH